MYRFAICDDDAADLLYVKNQIIEWAKGQHLEVDIREFSSAEGFLFAYAEEKEFDVLFLDIGIAEHQTGCLGENHSLGVAHTLLVETDAIG